MTISVFGIIKSDFNLSKLKEGEIISRKKVASDGILKSNTKAAAAVSKGEHRKKSSLK